MKPARNLTPGERALVGLALRQHSNGPEELIEEICLKTRIYSRWPRKEELTDNERFAADLGAQNGAVAMAIGERVFLNPKKVDTENVPLSLLKHEMTHVLQMARLGGFDAYAAAYFPSLERGGYNDDPFEEEARYVAEASTVWG